MSDKERTSAGAPAQNAIEAADIWSDGTETASDRRIRQFTLKELEKSKRTLPKERYDALVAAVGDILRSHYEREDEVHEIVRTKIAEFKKEVDAEREPGCLRNKFDPDLINGKETADYLTDATSTPEKFEAFKKLLKSDPLLLGGFLRYWALLGMRGEVSNYSNVKRIMAQNKGAEGVAKLNAYHSGIVESTGLVFNEETLMTKGKASTEQKNGAIVERMKTRYNFFMDTNGKYFERAGNMVSGNFEKVVGGRSLWTFGNTEIAEMISYAFVNSHKELPLLDESKRKPDALEALRTRLASDPEGLIRISEGWGGNFARTKPAIDTQFQVKEVGKIQKEFISTAKESFETASRNLVTDFVKKHLGNDVRPESVEKVSKEIRSAISNTKADAEPNYFGAVGGKIAQALGKMGAKDVAAADNIRLIRELLGLQVAKSNFDGMCDPYWTKYKTEFDKCDTPEKVDAAKAELLKKHPQEFVSIEDFAEIRKKELLAKGLDAKLGDRETKGKPPVMSETAAQSLLMTKAKNMGELSSKLKFTFESERARKNLSDHSETIAIAAGGKTSENANFDEAALRKAESVLSKKDPRTSKEESALLALLKYFETLPDLKREYVANASGKSYDEIVRMERNGDSVDAMFEKAKKGFAYPDSNKTSGIAKNSETPIPQGVTEFSRYFEGRNFRIGESLEFRFGNDAAPVEVKKTSDSQNPYVVTVDGKESFSCNEENLKAHLDMVKLLCDNGLEFLAPVSKEMLKTASLREGNLASAEDGSFTDREKRLLLKSFASVFEIEGFPSDATEITGMETYLKTFATERATTFRDLGMKSKILDENGNVRNREIFLSRLGK